MLQALKNNVTLLRHCNIVLQAVTTVKEPAVTTPEKKGQSAVSAMMSTSSTLTKLAR